LTEIPGRTIKEELDRPKLLQVRENTGSLHILHAHQSKKAQEINTLKMSEINLREMAKNQSGTIKSVKVSGELGQGKNLSWEEEFGKWDLFPGPR